MSEQFKNSQRGTSMYDSLSSDALEEILRADAQKLDDDSNLDDILYITGLLEKRAKENNERTVDVDEMLQRFELEIRKSTDHGAAPVSAEVRENAESPKKKRHRKPLIRLAAAVAAILCVLFLITGVTSAFGVNIWGIVATWTDELFGFGQTSKEGVEAFVDPDGYVYDQEYSSLQEALDSMGIVDISEPTVLQDSFALDYIDAFRDDMGLMINVNYSSIDGPHIVSVCIRTYNEDPRAAYEKTDNGMEPFSIGETQCHAFTNNNNQTIVWLTEEYECRIAGTISMEELKEVAVSMIVD